MKRSKFSEDSRAVAFATRCRSRACGSIGGTLAIHQRTEPGLERFE